MRLLICIPTVDYMHADFVKSLMKLTMRLKNDGVDFDVDILNGTLVYAARDKLARRAVKEGFTHTLWLDSDMVFTDDLLDDLMFSGKSFVTGVYHTRRPPHGSCIFKDIRLDSIERYDDGNYPKDTFEIAGCGFGCVLVETSLFEIVLERFGELFLPLPGLGEDIALCSRVHAVGGSMWCEPSVRCGHIGHITVWPEDRMRYIETVGG